MDADPAGAAGGGEVASARARRSQLEALEDRVCLSWTAPANLGPPINSPYYYYDGYTVSLTNNGLSHSDQVRVRERFRLSDDGSALLATQELEDPTVLDNRGARFITWKRKAGDHVYPYECDPSFALQYQNQHPPSDAPASSPK